MKQAFIYVAVTCMIGCATPPVLACGPWFPQQFLARGGTALLDRPEFFAEAELKIIARDFPTPFKAVRDEHPQERNARRDLEEFDAAIKDGSIRPPDPEAAREVHRRMRNALEELSTIYPEESAAIAAEALVELRAREYRSEFADYHEGVIAFETGDHAEARAIWQRLLERPERERRYRSVNAAFMIGVEACVDGVSDAPKWFARARELALQGFHDSGGLAAASYAREAESHEVRSELHEAAQCYLYAVASGYPLRECVQPADGSPEALAKFADDPLLRRVYTSLLLAEDGGRSEAMHPQGKFENWLAALEAVKAQRFAGAERVAWMCYDRGDYAAAKRWLRCAPADSVEALWLEGKLAAREGGRREMITAYTRAAQLVDRRPEITIEATPQNPEAETQASIFDGEHGIAALGAGQFQVALEAFLRGGHWSDAAYVAERLLTIQELESFVKKRPWRREWDAFSESKLEALATRANPDSDTNADDDHEVPAEERIVPGVVRTRQLRWLLARRLARMDRLEDARPYYPARERMELGIYEKALEQGKERNRSRPERAMTLWTAALEARYHGIELFGTEAAPDWFLLYGGNYEEDDPAAFRKGDQPVVRSDGVIDIHPLPAILRAGSLERDRLKASAIRPDQRFHYRYRAADLAWQAALLLPDNDPRLAEMLDVAGLWLAVRDDDAADRFYQALERRCAKTKIGLEATTVRWFVEIENYTIPTRPAEHTTQGAEQKQAEEAAGAG